MYNIIFTQRKSIKNFNRSLTILGSPRLTYSAIADNPEGGQAGKDGRRWERWEGVGAVGGRGSGGRWWSELCIVVRGWCF